MKKIRMKFRKGIVSLLAVGAFVLISVLSFYIITVIRNDIYQMHSYQLSMQAYYLAKEAASASLSALLRDDVGGALIQQTDWTQDFLFDTVEHKYNDVTVGFSDVTASGMLAPYYGENKQWVVLTIETRMYDNRAANTDGQFTYTMSVLILQENPSIQIYNINPEDLFGDAE